MRGRRRHRWMSILVGITAGAVLALLVIQRQDEVAAARAGALVPDCEGALRELVVHHVRGWGTVAGRPYRQLLRSLPAHVTVHVVCPDQGAFEELRQLTGSVRCRLSPVITGHVITGWSRDRWLPLSPPGAGEPTVLLTPRVEVAADCWPARAGDTRVAEDLARVLGEGVRTRRLRIQFDGGDVVADRETAFVSPRVLQRNLHHTVGGREELLAVLRRQLRRQVVLLDGAPDHHAGMYLMPVGNRTVLVGDPSLARQLPGGVEGLPLPCGVDLGAETQGRLDAVARCCQEAGYRVVRIPVVPGLDGRTYLTPLNALLDHDGARRVAYMPVYRGAEALAREATRIWREVGHEVVPVDCTDTYLHGGSLRCLVHVLRREPPGP